MYTERNRRDRGSLLVSCSERSLCCQLGKHAPQSSLSPQAAAAREKKKKKTDLCAKRRGKRSQPARHRLLALASHSNYSRGLCKHQRATQRRERKTKKKKKRNPARSTKEKKKKRMRKTFADFFFFSPFRESLPLLFLILWRSLRKFHRPHPPTSISERRLG